MANFLFLPNHTLIAPRPRLSASFSSKPQLLSLTNSSSIIINQTTSSRRASSFKSHLAPQDPAPTTNAKEGDSHNKVETSESGADQQNLSGLRTLLKVYKEAILYGDEKTVSEVKASIEVIENKKNELVQKVSSMSTEIASGKEKFIRLQADFDNCRKRFEKERLTVRTDAQGEVIESLLSMADNFERAKQQIKPETEKEKKIDASYQGIYKQFVEIMKSLHVAPVPTLGKPFDPSLHEAVAREQSLDFREGIIIQEIRRGFLLGDRLLRPAMVKVSTGPGTKKSAAEKSGLPATAAGVEKR